MPGNRVSMIAAGKGEVTGDTAPRLAAAFGTTPEFWMTLQTGYELAMARAALDEAELAGMRVA